MIEVYFPLQTKTIKICPHNVGHNKTTLIKALDIEAKEIDNKELYNQDIIGKEITIILIDRIY
jgi:hypothetical protein